MIHNGSLVKIHYASTETSLYTFKIKKDPEGSLDCTPKIMESYSIDSPVNKTPGLFGSWFTRVLNVDSSASFPTDCFEIPAPTFIGSSI